MAMEYAGNLRIGGTVSKLEAKKINDLSDVIIDKSELTDGQALKYDAEKDKWVNGDASVVANIEDLKDISLNELEEGQTLVYNTKNNKWVNGGAKRISYEEYMQLSPEEKTHGEYFVPDYPSTTTATIEDGKISLNSIWSSEKTNNEIAAVSDKIGMVPEGSTVENQITAINSKIDKFGIDSSRVLRTKAWGYADYSYTATENCFVIFTIRASANAHKIYIDGNAIFSKEELGDLYDTHYSIPLKAGQTIVVSGDSNLKVFGIK